MAAPLTAGGDPAANKRFQNFVENFRIFRGANSRLPAAIPRAPRAAGDGRVPPGPAGGVRPRRPRQVPTKNADENPDENAADSEHRY